MSVTQAAAPIPLAAHSPREWRRLLDKPSRLFAKTLLSLHPDWLPYTYAVASPDRPRGRFSLRIPDPVPGRHADIVLNFRSPNWCQIDFGASDFASWTFPRRGDRTEPVRQVADFLAELQDERRITYIACRDGRAVFPGSAPAMPPAAVGEWWREQNGWWAEADTLRTFSWRGTFDALVRLNHEKESEYMDKYVWDAMEATPLPAVTGSVMRRYVSGAEMTVARIAFSEGAVTAEHRHQNEQFSYVLEGTMEFTLEGKPLVVRSGEMIHLPSNLLHGARAVTAAIVLDVFSPPRADWETTR